jgi:NADH:ubiquinone oxidoreductase subunit 6 (subunit J)
MINRMDARWIYLLLVLGCVIFAYRTMVSTRILVSTLYLAGISAMVSIMLYMLGAYQVAAIELSVGAGLVTVLLVFAISVVGDDAFDPPSIIPKPFAFILVAVAAVLLGILALPITAKHNVVNVVPLSGILWEQRVLDVWIQMALIFSGTLGLLGVLAEGKSRQRSGLHTLVEVHGEVPQSELYKKIPLNDSEEQVLVVEEQDGKEAAWVKAEANRPVEER